MRRPTETPLCRFPRPKAKEKPSDLTSLKAPNWRRSIFTFKIISLFLVKREDDRASCRIYRCRICSTLSIAPCCAVGRSRRMICIAPTFTPGFRRSKPVFIPTGWIICGVCN